MKPGSRPLALALTVALGLPMAGAHADEARACVPASGDAERDARAAEIRATAGLLASSVPGRMNGRQMTDGTEHEQRLARTRGDTLPPVERVENTREGDERCVTVRLP